ncbi:ribonuclease H-like domain-containing protein [Tanacetum coccineum]
MVPCSKRLGLGYDFTKKACFVCGSFGHLIRDCDFHEKRMAKQVKLNKKKGRGTGQGENRLDDFFTRMIHKKLKDKGIFDSGCSKALDWKNKVLFTDTECLLLSLDFKLLDENQILLRVPRQNNMYSFNLENIVLTRGLKGSKMDICNARTPQQNIVAERKNRTLIEDARTMLADSFLPNTFWAEVPITAGPKEANQSAGTQDTIDAGNSQMELNCSKKYLCTATNKDQGDQAFLEELERLKRQEKEANDAAKVFSANYTNIINTVSTSISTASPSNVFSAGGPDINNDDQDDSQIPALEGYLWTIQGDGIFTNASYDDEGAVADFTNLETIVNVSPITTSRIHSIHPTTQILRDPILEVQTRSKIKPKKISQALKDESLVDAMQEELLQFKIQKVWILVDLPFGTGQLGKNRFTEIRRMKELGLKPSGSFWPLLLVWDLFSLGNDGL